MGREGEVFKDGGPGVDCGLVCVDGWWMGRRSWCNIANRRGLGGTAHASPGLSSLFLLFPLLHSLRVYAGWHRASQLANQCRKNPSVFPSPRGLFDRVVMGVNTRNDHLVCIVLVLS